MTTLVVLWIVYASGYGPPMPYDTYDTAKECRIVEDSVRADHSKLIGYVAGLCLPAGMRP